MKIWDRMSYMGVKSIDTASGRTTQVLANRLIFIIFLIAVSYIPIYIFLGATKLLTLAIALTVLSSIVIYVNKQGKHQLALVLLIFSLTGCIISLSFIDTIMSYEINRGMIHLFLLSILSIGITFIKNLKYGVLISVLILISFGIMELVKYKSNYSIKEVDINHVILHFVNTSTIFIVIIYSVFHYKMVSLHYSVNLINQKIRLEKQHVQLEKNHEEVRNSIEYAKRIQAAILSSDKLIKKYFSDSFIIYYPKDIVAGDFYWTQKIDDHILFAVADCTGHGVPGALVSVVCNNALNRAVREYKLPTTGEILDKTRALIIKEFEKSEESVQDGMDIALIKMPVNAKEGETVSIEYSGANNPLWIIRDHQLMEYKPNKQPVANYERPTPFKTHTIDLKKDDCLYIFSDGFVDQFGGAYGKKFKNNAFRKLLINVHRLPMQEQRKRIKNEFRNWKGDYDQIDDICVIGARI